MSAADDWQLRDRTIVMCFDTTSRNTGKFSGVSVTFAKKKIYGWPADTTLLSKYFEECP